MVSRRLSSNELYKMEETFHTEGFYKRESSLFYQLVPKEEPHEKA